MTDHQWALSNQVVALSRRPQTGDPCEDTGTQSWVSLLECTLTLQSYPETTPKMRSMLH